MANLVGDCAAELDRQAQGGPEKEAAAQSGLSDPGLVASIIDGNCVALPASPLDKLKKASLIPRAALDGEFLAT